MVATRNALGKVDAVARRRRREAKHQKALRELNKAMDAFKQVERDYALMLYDDTNGDQDRFLAAVERV
jgi:hypothetical protein